MSIVALLLFFAVSLLVGRFYGPRKFPHWVDHGLFVALAALAIANLIFVSSWEN